MARKRQGKIRRALFKKQDGKCCYCDGATYLMGSAPMVILYERFGIVVGIKGGKRLLVYHLATFEHLRRKSDGGKFVAHNGMLACQFCNVSRGEVDIRTHRVDMQALVAAGVHPVNRPPGRVDNANELRRLALSALAKLRKGESLQPTERADDSGSYDTAGTETGTAPDPG